MFSLVQSLCPLSGCERVLLASFTDRNSVNLVCSIENFLRIYTVTETNLRLEWEEQLFGKVCDFARIQRESQPDALLISFFNAKAAIAVWDAVLQQPKISSLHYFEKEFCQTETIENNFAPQLQLEPEQRCACMRVYKEFIAFIPMQREKPDEELYFDAFSESFVSSFLSFDKEMRNVVDFVFLPGYPEPTLAILYEPDQTFAGRFSAKKDSFKVAFVSVNLASRLFTILFTSDFLPHGCFKIVAIDRPVGGVLVLFPDGLIHVEQGTGGLGCCVNQFPTLTGSTAFKFRHNFSKLRLSLSGAVAHLIGNGKVLLCLQNGTIQQVSLLKIGNRFVSEIQLESIAVDLLSVVRPSSISLLGTLLAVGSRFSDSIVCSATLEQDIESVDQKLEATNGFDEIDTELFGSSVQQSSSAKTRLQLRPTYRVVSYGPVRDFSIGVKPIITNGVIHYDPANVQLVCSTGAFKSGGISVHERRAIPKIVASFSFPQCNNLWSLPAADSDLDRLLVLSTSHSTLVMEIVDQEFQEIAASGFFLEGPSIFSGVILNRTFVLQVIASEFRLVRNDHFTQLVASHRHNSLFPIVGCCLLGDSAFATLDENGSVSIFAVTLAAAVSVVATISEISCMCSFSVSDVVHLCVLGRDSGLRILVLPSLVPIFKALDFSSLSQVFLNTLHHPEPNRPLQSKFFREIRSISISAEKTLLVLQTETQDTFLYCYSAQLNRFFRMKTSFYPEDERSSLPSETSVLVPLGSCSKGTFLAALSSESAVLVVPKETQYPRIFPLSVNDSILCMTAHHSRLVNDGFIFITQTGSLSVGTLDDSFDFSNGWLARKYSLGVDVSQVEFSPSSNKYVAATSVLVPATIPSGDRSVPYVVPEDSENILPRATEFTLRLFSPVNWETIDSYRLSSFEMVTVIRNVSLRYRHSLNGYKDFIVVGIGYQRSEERQIRGKLLLLEVISVVPDPTNPETNHKLKLVLAEEVKGPVTAVDQVDGYLMAAVGPRLMTYAFDDEQDDDSLIAIGFLDVSIGASSLATIKNFFVLGDIFRSCHFGVWQEEPPKLAQLGRDSRNLPVGAADFILAQQSLSVVAADLQGNLHFYSYQPVNTTTANYGTSLVKRSHIHIGSKIVRLVRYAVNAETLGLFYVTVDGAIGVVLPVPEKTFKRLFSIFSRMSATVQHTFGLSSAAYRADVGNSSMMRAETGDGRCVLDADLAFTFLSLSKEQQRDIVHYVGTTIPTVFRDFSLIASLIKRPI